MNMSWITAYYEKKSFDIKVEKFRASRASYASREGRTMFWEMVYAQKSIWKIPFLTFYLWVILRLRFYDQEDREFLKNPSSSYGSFMDEDL